MNATSQTSRKWLYRMGRLLHAARTASGSLRVKIGLSVLAASAAGFTLLALFFGITVERETREIVTNQQRTIARNVANDTGQKIALARDALTELAQRLPLDRLDDAAAMQALIRDGGALFALLDDLVLLGADGVVIADWPVAPRRRGTDRSQAEHFRSVMAGGEARLSRPFIGPLLQVPVVILSVPVLDASRRVAAVISGIIRLNRPNFIGDLATRKIGSTGYFMLVDAEGTVMIDPRPDRVMGKVNEDAAGAAISALRGGASRLHESPRGGIYTASEVPGTGWVLVAVLPREEAYHSLASMQWTLGAIFALLLAATGVLIWPLVGRLLAPLAALRAATQALAPGATGSARLDLSGVPRGTTEIDALADAFRRAVDRAETAKALLRAEHAFVDAVIENAGALVVVLDREGRIRRFNRACEELSGYRLAEVEGKFPWHTVLPPEDAATIRQEAFEALARNPQALSGRYTNHWVTKAREKRLIEWFNTVLLDAAGDMEYMVSIGVDVTETRMAQAALARNEQHVRLLLDSMPLAVGHADAAERITFANRMYRQFYSDGVEPVGLTIHEAIGDDLYAEVRPRIQRVLAGAAAHYERSFPRSDGTTGTRSVRYIPELSADGRVIGFFALIEDITQRKRAEQALRESEARLLSLFEHSPISVWEKDFSALKARLEQLWASGMQDCRAYLDAHPEEVARCADLVTVVDVNETSVRFFGARSKEEIARNLPDYFTEESLAVFREEIVALAEGRTRFESEITIRMPDRSLKQLQLSVAVVPGHEVSLSRVLVSFMDITDRRRAEEQLRASERGMRDAQQLAKVGSWQLDLLKGRLHWSEEIFRIFEIDPEQFGASYEAFLEAIHPDDRETVNRAYTDSLATRAPYEVTHRLRMPDGRIKYVHERCESEFDAAGRPLRSVGTVQDITTQRLAEDRVRAALAEKEVLLQEIYHRVKNNLQVVSSLLNMQGRAIANPAVKELLAESANRVKSMALVHEQLYRSQDLSNISLAQYFKQLAEHLQYAHRPLSARVPLRLEVADLKLGIETAVPLGLIVNELVSNAYKHGYGAEALGGEIVLRAEGLDDGRVRLEVADDGRGLPENFEPTRVTSLGMQLVVTLAAQLAGELRHRSDAGRTSFEVLFRPEAREADRLVA